MSDAKAEVRLADGIDALRGMRAGSASLLLSDLPSGETRAKFDRCIDLVSFWPAAWRALRPDGAVVLMASSLRFAASVVESQRQFFRYDLVWHKSVATGFLNAKHRPLRSHEFILVFFRERSHYVPQMAQGASPIHAARRLSHGENYNAQTRSNKSRAGATDRYPASVLEFASVGTSSRERKHPQQKPEALLRWLVRSYSPDRGLVIDPFAGSGSTRDAALAEGREALCWDNDPRFGKSA